MLTRKQIIEEELKTNERTGTFIEGNIPDA